MSWNAIISGELKFPVGHIDKWLAAAGVLPRHAWPFLAVVDEDFGAEEDDAHLLTVAGRICTQQILCGGSFIADTVGDEVRLRAVVGEDEFWGAVNEGGADGWRRATRSRWGERAKSFSVTSAAAGATTTAPSCASPGARSPPRGSRAASQRSLAEDFAVMEEVQARAAPVEAAALAMRKEKVLARKSAPPKKRAPKKCAPQKKGRKK